MQDEQAVRADDSRDLQLDTAVVGSRPVAQLLAAAAGADDGLARVHHVQGVRAADAMSPRRTGELNPFLHELVIADTKSGHKSVGRRAGLLRRRCPSTEHRHSADVTLGLRARLDTGASALGSFSSASRSDVDGVFGLRHPQPLTGLHLTAVT